MAGRLVFMVEEPSMKLLLDALLPRLMPGWVAEQHFKCVPHQGKSDLDISVPRKLSKWRIPGDRFVIALMATQNPPLMATSNSPT
jgi:hypothetical protein